MTNANASFKLLLASAILATTTFTIGCNNTSHPDDKQAVNSALDQHDLSSVMVDQDRGKGVIKLTGIVGSQDRKDAAQQLAQQAAPGYTIDNQLKVDQGSILTSPSTPPANQSNPADASAASTAPKAKPHKK